MTNTLPFHPAETKPYAREAFCCACAGGRQEMAVRNAMRNRAVAAEIVSEVTFMLAPKSTLVLRCLPGATGVSTILFGISNSLGKGTRPGLARFPRNGESENLSKSSTGRSRSGSRQGVCDRDRISNCRNASLISQGDHIFARRSRVTRSLCCLASPLKKFASAGLLDASNV